MNGHEWPVPPGRANNRQQRPSLPPTRLPFVGQFESWTKHMKLLGTGGHGTTILKFDPGQAESQSRGGG